MKRLIPAILALFLSAPAYAAGDGAEIESQSWSWDGLFGTYDREQLQNGLEIYLLQCHNCHSLKYVNFRNLTELGMSEDEVKALAEQFEVPGELDEWGDPTVRPAALYDGIPSPFPNDVAARASNGGALPPDLSLMAKARSGGPDYIFALLTDHDYNGGAPVDGLYPNHVFPGGWIAMSPPLYEGLLVDADGNDVSVEEMARDISAFLMWAAEPKLEDRKGMGIKVLLFLLILTGLFYVSKRKIWANVDH